MGDRTLKIILGPPLVGRNGRQNAKDNSGGAPGGGKEWERNEFTLWGRPWWEGMGGGLLNRILGVPLRGRNGRGINSLSGAAPGGKEWEAGC
jgi:hypothetical protein